MTNNLLPDVGNIILVASGKGGVGKSTVAANLAVTFARNGLSAGILDADLYGPSIPIQLGLEDKQAGIIKIKDKDMMEPAINYGVKVISLAFLMKKEDAIIWRGPMASNALTQLIEQTYWGKLDYLIIDMPPGTGDIAITLAQKLPRAKAVVVITPQKLAMADGLKAGNMFSAKGIHIPVLGVIENMSCFVPEKHPDEKYYLFGTGGGQQLADMLGVPLLAQIPMVADVSELGDSGKTVFASSNAIISEAYEKLANKIMIETTQCA